MTMAYFAPDDELIEELCQASRRGIQVRLMLPRWERLVQWAVSRARYLL